MNTLARTLAKPLLLTAATLVAAGCSTTTPTTTATADQAKPLNVVFIMTDDHAYQAISAYGSKLIKTPNIDRIAAGGVRFDRAYTSNAICSPSRAVTLTGKFSHLNGVTDNFDVFDGSQQTFPKLMQQYGYTTGIVGKWHLKSEPTGFDYWQVLPDQGHYYHPELRTAEGTIKAQGYVTDVITDKAVEFLDQVQQGEQPFMLMYQHKAPHRQWWPSMQELDDIGKQAYPQPDTLLDDYQGRGSAAKTAEMRIADHMALSADNKITPKNIATTGNREFAGWYEPAYEERLARLSEEEKSKWQEVYGPINDAFVADKLSGDALTEWKYQRYMQDYLATIVSVDRNIGRLLDELERRGLSDNTLIIYTSDQGFYLGEHGWFDKRFMYEESFRTPLIIHAPGQQSGTVNRQLVQNIDYAPTILDMAGIDVPEDMQGLSLKPILQDASSEWRDSLYYHYYEYPSIHMVKRHYGVMTERYKLIHFYHDIDEWELYDLHTDPDEKTNLIDHPDYQHIRVLMTEKLRQQQGRYEDSPQLAKEMLEQDLATHYRDL